MGDFVVHPGMETDRRRTVRPRLGAGGYRQQRDTPRRFSADNGWLDVETNKQVYYVRPTHWRDWPLN